MSTPTPATVCKGLALTAFAVAFMPVPGSQALSVKLFSVDAASQAPHLWYRYGGSSSCGEVDAALRMPKALFDPENANELEVYKRLTSTYKPGLALGRCADLGATIDVGLTTISWTGSIAMASYCQLQGCCASYPCKDQPDDPARGKWCSLCGPKYNANINITLYTSPPPPTPPPPRPTPAPPAPNNCSPKEGCNVCEACCESFIPNGDSCNACVKKQCAPKGQTIVDLAVATPDLSTLVTARTAGDLVATLSDPGPFTVFAPTNEAFAKLPAGTVASLLQKKNQKQLVDILTYHVVSGSVHAKDLKDGQMVKTVEGTSLTVRISSSGEIFINSAKVTTADVDASNGVVHIIDAVLMPA